MVQCEAAQCVQLHPGALLGCGPPALLPGPKAGEPRFWLGLTFCNRRWWPGACAGMPRLTPAPWLTVVVGHQTAAGLVLLLRRPPARVHATLPRVQLPMVLAALPVGFLSVYGCWTYFAADWLRALTLGLFRWGDPLPAGLHWLASCLPAPALQAGKAPQVQGRRRSARLAAAAAPPPRGTLECREEMGYLATAAAPYIYHWAFMTAFALLAMNVNVATRCAAPSPEVWGKGVTQLVQLGVADLQAQGGGGAAGVACLICPCWYADFCRSAPRSTGSRHTTCWAATGAAVVAGLVEQVAGGRAAAEGAGERTGCGAGALHTMPWAACCFPTSTPGCEGQGV